MIDNQVLTVVFRIAHPQQQQQQQYILEADKKNISPHLEQYQTFWMAKNGQSNLYMQDAMGPNKLMNLKLLHSRQWYWI